MNIEKYTVKTQEAVKGAIDLAVRKGNQFVTPLHLLGTILDLNDPTMENLIIESGGNLPVLKSGVASELEQRQVRNAGTPVAGSGTVGRQQSVRTAEVFRR